MKNIFKRVGAFALTLVVTLTSINLSGLTTEKAYAADSYSSSLGTYTIDGQVFEQLELGQWYRSPGCNDSTILRWVDDGTLWKRMNDFNPTQRFSWGGDHEIDSGDQEADWERHWANRTARTVRLQTTVQLDKDCWGRADDLSKVHFSVNSYKKDTSLYVDDGYWIFAYPSCMKDDINNTNMWDYWVMGCFWQDSNADWPGRMEPALGNKVEILSSRTGTTKLLDNASKAFRNGFKNGSKYSNWDGKFIIDVWYFEINCGGKADEFIFGIHLDDNVKITETRSVTYKGGSGATGTMDVQYGDKDTDVKIKSNGFKKNRI